MTGAFSALQVNNDFTNHYKNGSNANIIDVFFLRYKQAMEQGKILAPIFQKKTFEESCRHVWNFVKYSIKYQVDEEGQLIQAPSYLLHNKKGDCKSKTLLCAAIISNFNFGGKKPIVTIRFVNYEKINSYTHVYLLASLGKEIFIVDTVWNLFNSEKVYFSAKDFNMEINSISGFEAASSYSIEGRRSKKERKERRKKNFKKGFHAFKKANLAPMRLPFLGLVALNARGLAKKLNAAPKEKVEKIWMALGGDPKKLFSTIAKGAKKKPFLGERVNGIGDIQDLRDAGVGVVATASISAMLVAAAAVLAAFKPLFKKHDAEAGAEPGTSTDEIFNEAKDGGADFTIPEGKVGDGEPGSGSEPAEGLLGLDFSNPKVMLGTAVIGYIGLKALKIIK